MATDIKLNNDSVEVDGSLKVAHIISEDLKISGGVTIVGREEHIANGFTHLLLNPESVVFETFHIGSQPKRFDVKQELGRLGSELKQVIADVKALSTQQSAPAPDAAAGEHQALRRQIAILERRVALLESKVS